VTVSPTSLRHRRAEVFAVAILLLPLVLAVPALVTGRAWSPAANLYTGYPWQGLTADAGALNPALSDVTQWFHLPLWVSHAYAGASFFANPQTALLFPLTWLAWLLPAAPALTLITALKLVGAGLAMFWFLRADLGLAVTAALIGALGPTPPWRHPAGARGATARRRSDDASLLDVQAGGGLGGRGASGHACRACLARARPARRRDFARLRPRRAGRGLFPLICVWYDRHAMPRLPELIGRAMIDPDFLAQLQKSPDEILAQYELDETERRTVLGALARLGQTSATERAQAFHSALIRRVAT
jgi:hypothetical protein